ncbi:hypothetical protein [Helicobacter cetorum]|uniref:hypothetical protein n=1 Tax=Helicobacter cetorum TaxID=138563 RepID=UPI000CF19BCD|nr:hypothetical protein [Helicobacter cetorum]
MPSKDNGAFNPSFDYIEKKFGKDGAITLGRSDGTTYKKLPNKFPRVASKVEAPSVPKVIDTTKDNLETNHMIIDGKRIHLENRKMVHQGDFGYREVKARAGANVKTNDEKQYLLYVNDITNRSEILDFKGIKDAYVLSKLPYDFSDPSKFNIFTMDTEAIYREMLEVHQFPFDKFQRPFFAPVWENHNNPREFIRNRCNRIMEHVFPDNNEREFNVLDLLTKTCDIQLPEGTALQSRKDYNKLPYKDLLYYNYLDKEEKDYRERYKPLYTSCYRRWYEYYDATVTQRFFNDRFMYQKINMTRLKEWGNGLRVPKHINFRGMPETMVKRILRELKDMILQNLEVNLFETTSALHEYTSRYFLEYLYPMYLAVREKEFPILEKLAHEYSVKLYGYDGVITGEDLWQSFYAYITPTWGFGEVGDICAVSWVCQKDLEEGNLHYHASRFHTKSDGEFAINLAQCLRNLTGNDIDGKESDMWFQMIFGVDLEAQTLDTSSYESQFDKSRYGNSLTDSRWIGVSTRIDKVKEIEKELAKHLKAKGGRFGFIENKFTKEKNWLERMAEIFRDEPEYCEEVYTLEELELCFEDCLRLPLTKEEREKLKKRIKSYKKSGRPLKVTINYAQDFT